MMLVRHLISRCRYLLALSLLIGISGCLSEIDIDIPDTAADNLVIVSQLSKGDPSVIETRITRLSSFSVSTRPEPIEGATVTLIDESGNAEAVADIGMGNYQTVINNLQIEAGKSYQLIAEINGQTYESTLEKLHEVPRATQINHSDFTRVELNNAGNLIDARYIRFFINTPLAPANSDEKVYLKWDFTSVYRFVETTIDSPFPPETSTCYNSQVLNLDKITVFNGPESRQDVLENEFLLEEALDYRFSRGFYLSVYQQTLSQGAYEYWDQINTITDLSGSFFEDPPGKILGNFKNTADPNEEVFGYFYATQTDTVRVLVRGEDYNARSLCPGIGLPSNDEIRPSCFDCLTLLNSSLEKPSYWVD